MLLLFLLAVSSLKTFGTSELCQLHLPCATASIKQECRINFQPITKSSMGNLISFALGPNLEDELSSEWLEVFKAMKLSRPEVKKLFAIFNAVDIDKSGTIEVVELLTLLDIERTMFAERIFAAFDKDGTGKVDFYEFVVSLWKFCTLANGSIGKLIFSLK
jgi:hypothetical protein